ncbi:replication-relaxation family protein [Ornithinibacillus scapharcae]|uniref:replication-relaxation family protein n=1 Tax=Ornithinibacillus scapharcae TaxID=1147159 RepID=UPI000225B02B|nr:hypothetical protein [Ornithinibacillus scapharcae]
MKKRDLNIIKDLERFRVMSRNQIVELYFSHLKSPISNANAVLKRLVRDGQIEFSNHHSPYVYFPAGSNMKKNSTKIPHYLTLVDIYVKLRPKTFELEPKFKKGLAEPDIFTIIKGTPFFIEVQRNVYSQKVMNEKIKRYEALYFEIDRLPYILMITDKKYEINSEIVKVLQVNNFDEFLRKIS